jgi:adenylyl-sulfate kinase
LSNKNLSNELFLVTRQQKEALNKQKAFVVWLTGLSGSGKSTIARNLEVVLFQAGIRTLILDGDNTRMSINSDLDFSINGRKENIRRVAEIAKLLNDAGVVVITAFISPFTEDRETAKKIIGEDCFVEVFVDTSLELCMERDAKGLYKKALDGELLDFTGISSPYEIPQKPQLTLTTNNDSPLDSTRIIYNWLLINKYIVK